MGIWDFSEYFSPKIKPEFQISLDEGDTSCENYQKFAKSIGLLNLYLKREDRNPTGSQKDRQLAFQISAHLQDGEKEFVISSSGNAAISAAAYCQKSGLKLHIFLSPNTEKSKLERFQKIIGKDFLNDFESILEKGFAEIDNLNLHFNKKAKSAAFKFAQENDFIFLRGSTDDYALEGIKTIAFELFKQAFETDSIFIPCSSGTTVSGIYEGYSQMKDSLPVEEGWKIPQIHLIQTTKVNTIAREFDKDFTQTETSIATAIVDRVAHRKEQAIHDIIETDGFGWVVNDDEIIKGLEVLKSFGVESSAEGGMTIAAILKALKKGWSFNSPVCVITGME